LEPPPIISTFVGGCEVRPGFIAQDRADGVGADTVLLGELRDTEVCGSNGSYQGFGELGIDVAFTFGATPSQQGVVHVVLLGADIEMGDLAAEMVVTNSVTNVEVRGNWPAMENPQGAMYVPTRAFNADLGIGIDFLDPLKASIGKSFGSGGEPFVEVKGFNELLG